MHARESYGSPPRSWGKPSQTCTSAVDPRFTPTLVGKTATASMTAAGHRFTPTLVGKTRRKVADGSAATVHPHARGENTNHCAVCADERFTPTLVGKTRVGKFTASGARFTPTLVGKTSGEATRLPHASVHPHARGENFCRHSAVYRAVHPHARGENLAASASGGPAPGSPPRSWGKHRSRDAATSIAGSPPRSWGKLGDIAHRRASADGSPPRSWGKLSCALLSAALPVHPHARGENDSSDGRPADRNGSPPRSWGKLCDALHVETGFGSPPRSWGKPFGIMFTEGEVERVAVRRCRSLHAWLRRRYGSGSAARCWLSTFGSTRPF